MVSLLNYAVQMTRYTYINLCDSFGLYSNINSSPVINIYIYGQLTFNKSAKEIQLEKWSFQKYDAQLYIYSCAKEVGSLLKPHTTI